MFIPISGWTADRFGRGGRSAWRSSSSHGFDWLRHGQFARRLGRRPDRVGIGGALMLQVGFGLDALSSGLSTFASAAGATTMKMTARGSSAPWGFASCWSATR
ncbi:MAG TPA: hypothetical protein VN849_13215 [Stellaceae bacterium]|nr:hypothetical protein [Stellaceae bacterium]